MSNTLNTKKNFYINILWSGFLFIMTLALAIYFSLISEQDVIEQVINRKLSGISSTRIGIILQKFIVNHWGRIGLILFTILLSLFFLYRLWKETERYRRYRHRERMIYEGVMPISKIFDNDEPISLIDSIKDIFRRKKSKHKYPSEKEMRNSLKKNKYYKE